MYIRNLQQYRTHRWCNWYPWCPPCAWACQGPPCSKDQDLEMHLAHHCLEPGKIHTVKDMSPRSEDTKRSFKQTLGRLQILQFQSSGTSGDGSSLDLPWFTSWFSNHQILNMSIHFQHIISTVVWSPTNKNHGLPHHPAVSAAPPQGLHLPVMKARMYPPAIEHSYGKLPFIVDCPMKNGDFPQLC